MKNSKKFKLMFRASCFMLALVCLNLSNLSAQLFKQAYNSDLATNSNSNDVIHTNNDYVEAWTYEIMSVVVWDGTDPGLYFDDRNGHTGTISLGSGIGGAVVYNPDVSISSDTHWAVVVYEDIGNSSNIVAEWYEWYSNQYNYSSYTILDNYGGRDPKIDNYFDQYGNDKFAVAWVKYDYLAILTSAGDLSGGGGSPNFYPMVALQQTNTYSSPDVGVYDGNVYYTYVEDVSSNSTLTVEVQTWTDVAAGTLSGPNYELQYYGAYYTYDLPRISCNKLIADDWAVVAQTPNASTSGYEIHGFVKDGGNVNSYSSGLPFVYNDGSLYTYSGGIYVNDITNVPNYNPVVSYVGDYIYILWTVDATGSAITDLINQDILAIRIRYNGHTFAYTNAPYDNMVVNYCTDTYQYAPSISGRSSTFSNDFLAAFFTTETTCANSVDVYYKQENYTAFHAFRLASQPDFKPSVDVHPNPFTDELFVNLPLSDKSENEFTLCVMDVFGKIIFDAKRIKQEIISWQVPKDVAPGIYFLTIKDKNSSVNEVKKIVKQ